MVRLWSSAATVTFSGCHMLSVKIAIMFGFFFEVHYDDTSVGHRRTGMWGESEAEETKSINFVSVRMETQRCTGPRTSLQ